MHSGRSSGSVYGTRNASPDLVINTQFSSPSASLVDRCPFASDALDQHSLASDISLQLGGNDPQHGCCSTGVYLDLEQNKPTVNTRHSRLSRKGEVFVTKCNNEPNFDYQNESLDSARSSFSLALKVCQERRNRSGPLAKEPDRRKPVSLDMNNFDSSSPRLGMKNSSTVTRMTGILPSSCTPSYRQASGVVQKGSSSERVPLHDSAGQMHASAFLLPYNNGRALPSKWEDAERWICSPALLDTTSRTSFPLPERRPKSKSGPLGPSGAAYCSLYSPGIPMFDGMKGGTFARDSPFSSGIIPADGWTTKTYWHGLDFPFQAEPWMARSASVHGCSEDFIQPSKQPQVSRKDMATQMSPEGSTHSSPQTTPPFSARSASALPIVELQSIQSSEAEVRDVQIDERVTTAKWSKKKKLQITRKDSEVIDDWKWKENPPTSAWDVSEAAKSISKYKREEAKITAWENLQKAKAEAAIRKLEMKLEKKRSSSMDKIMNKLRLSKKRAQEMRSAVLASQAHQVNQTSHSSALFWRTRQMSSLSGCFTCHAF